MNENFRNIAILGKKMRQLKDDYYRAKDDKARKALLEGMKILAATMRILASQ